MHRWAPDVIDAVGGREPNPGGVVKIFYATSPTSQQAGHQAFGRGPGPPIATRLQPCRRDKRSTPLCQWGHPRSSGIAEVAAIRAPGLLLNSYSNPMIVPPLL